MGRRIFFWAPSKFIYIPTKTSKVRSHFREPRGVLKNRMKASRGSQKCNLTDLDARSGNSKDTKYEKAETVCFNNVYGSLIAERIFLYHIRLQSFRCDTKKLEKSSIMSLCYEQVVLLPAFTSPIFSPFGTCSFISKYFPSICQAFAEKIHVYRIINSLPAVCSHALRKILMDWVSITLDFQPRVIRTQTICVLLMHQQTGDI